MTDPEGAPLASHVQPAWDDGGVDVVRTGGVTRISLGGEVDMGTVGRVRSFVEAECRGRSRKVVIDLSAVEFVDSHGLHFFAETHRTLTGEGRSLVFVAPPDLVWRTFVITGLDRLLVVEPDA
jgi:anti-anti-sigma factor